MVTEESCEGGLGRKDVKDDWRGEKWMKLSRDSTGSRTMGKEPELLSLSLFLCRCMSTGLNYTQVA